MTRWLVIVSLLPAVPAWAEDPRNVVGIQVLGGSGTHVGNLDIGRHHELRTFVRLGPVQPVIWISSSAAHAGEAPATLDIFGYGGGVGIVERYRGITVELAGGVAHRSLDIVCAVARGDGSKLCGHDRWGPQLRLGMTIERSKPLGIFATGFELVAEHVELQPGSRGVLVLAGIVLTGGLGSGR